MDDQEKVDRIACDMLGGHDWETVERWEDDSGRIHSWHCRRCPHVGIPPNIMAQLMSVIRKA